MILNISSVSGVCCDRSLVVRAHLITTDELNGSLIGRYAKVMLTRVASSATTSMNISQYLADELKWHPVGA